MTAEGIENKKEEGVLQMAILAKPVKVPLTVKSDKIEEFKKTFTAQKISDVQEKAKKITNIAIKG